jgi:heavy metal sensor kinase
MAMQKLRQIRPSNIPLRLRLTLWFTASLALILLVFATLLYLQLQYRLLSQLDAGLEIVAAQAHLNLGEQDGHLAFQNIENNPDFIRNLNENYVVYLLQPDGSVGDRLGNDDEATPDTRLITGHATHLTDTGTWRVYSQPVNIGRLAGWLQVTQELNPVEQILENLLNQMVFGVPVALVLAAVGGFFLATRALQPIDHITRTAQAINASDLDQRIDYTGPMDEVGRLAATFDRMLARLQRAFERERRFTGDAAHELRTPLTALKGHIGVTLSRSRQPTEYIGMLQEMEGQVDRLIRLSSDLLFIARLDQGMLKQRFDAIILADFMGAVVDQIRPLAQAKAITLVEKVPEDITIEGDMDLLIRLFMNLLDNAIKFTPQNGRVTIQAQANTQTAQIAIRDSGAGIAAEHLPHLFNRFYRIEDGRTREWGSNGQGGAGLGLAIAYEITRTHGGQLSVASTIGEGTTITVQLPLIHTPL